MNICEEMKKLREMLDNRGIEWHDLSDITSEEIITQLMEKGLQRGYADTTIWRTHFEVDNIKYSVINGFGTYGGFNSFTGHNLGLLECMTEKVNGGEPVGHLTAEEVIHIIDN